MIELFRQHRVLRFLVTGGTTVATNLGLLFVLTEFLGLWYMFSATLSYLSSMAVGFTLNKFWTFTDSSQDRTHSQVGIYFIVNVVNLVLNNGLLYLLVEGVGLWYLMAQVITSIVLAFESFFIYRWIFRETNKEVQTG